MKTIIEKVEQRIAELNQADADFFKERWDMSIPAHQRATAREESNKVAFARQELERLLLLLKQESETQVELQAALKELLECDYTSGTHLHCAQVRAKKALAAASRPSQEGAQK